MLTGGEPSSSVQDSLPAGSNGGLAVSGRRSGASSRDELAALVDARTNPGYRDYMTQGMRRGSEAFG